MDGQNTCPPDAYVARVVPELERRVRHLETDTVKTGEIVHQHCGVLASLIASVDTLEVGVGEVKQTYATHCIECRAQNEALKTAVETQDKWVRRLILTIISVPAAILAIVEVIHKLQ